MKFPISKQLTDFLFVLCISYTGVGLFDLFSTGQKRFDQNVMLIILFGIPTLLFAWFLNDKKIEFNDNKKVRKEDRWFQLPFSSFSTLFIILMSSLLMFTGLVVTFEDKDFTSGLPMLLVALSIIILTAIAFENPKIWFSDSSNLEDDIERIRNTPKENFPAYQDGVFSYSDTSFVIQIDKEVRTINWDEITLIRAYKIDQFAYDCIVIEIHYLEICISINDQTPGHMKFMEIASEKLTDFKKDWFSVVAFPAFETNLITIYEKQTAVK